MGYVEIVNGVKFCGQKNYKIMQGYYIIVADLLKIAVIFYRNRFLRYSQNAAVFAVSNRIRLQY